MSSHCAETSPNNNSVPENQSNTTRSDAQAQNSNIFIENRVIESAEFISQNSKHVKLGTDDEYKKAAVIVEDLAKKWRAESWSDFPLHPSELSDPEKKAAYVFLIDTMNYAFWTETGHKPYTVSYNGKPYTGYWSLCAAIKNAVLKDEKILDAEFWAKATVEDWGKIFTSETETPCPFLEWRQKTISEAGRYLINNFEGSTYKMIKSCNKSAVALAELVRANLDSYKDQYEYHGRTVYFLKRAQIFAADLYFAFAADNNYVAEACSFTDINKLTMFADYRVPQALNYLHLIHYDDYLMNELKERPHFPPGSELECEIRGCSIAAVEKLKKFISYPKITSVLIDFVLWPYAKENTELMAHIPIHQTRSVFY